MHNQNDPHSYVGPSPVIRDMQRRHAKRIQYAPEARLIAFGEGLNQIQAGKNYREYVEILDQIRRL